MADTRHSFGNLSPGPLRDINGPVGKCRTLRRKQATALHWSSRSLHSRAASALPLTPPPLASSQVGCRRERDVPTPCSQTVTQAAPLVDCLAKAASLTPLSPRSIWAARSVGLWRDQKFVAV